MMQKSTATGRKYHEDYEHYAIYSIVMEAFYDNKGNWSEDFIAAYASEEKARMIIRRQLWKLDWSEVLIVPCDVTHHIAYDNRGMIEKTYMPDFAYAIRMV
jgi:hypothetical protein